jgi:uncharacterized protein (DUF2147 family)
MKRLFLTLASTFICFAASLSAQTVVGTWKTIDDETKEAKSYVEVFENNGKLYGKITKLLLKPADTVCDKCKDDKKNQKVVGMIIVSDLSLKDGYYQGGSILDPTKGDYYKCSLWLQAGDANVMNVKGKHWSGISRTQKWYRVN